VPLHVAAPFAGTAQAVHDVVPHELVELLLAHAPLQSWYPVLHEMPQLVPSHVAAAFAGTAHAVHDVVPHEPVELLLEHAPLQS